MREPGTQPITNDAVRVVPRTDVDAPALAFAFPSVRVGVAEYDEGPTGCTVFHFPRSATAAVDVRGGSHATIYTEPLAHGDGNVDAICLAGGSFYGLEAATGAAAELFAMRGYDTQWLGINRVSGAVIFDYRRRDGNAIYPDKALGRAAVRAAREGWLPLGPRGAGCSASVGKGMGSEYGEPSGQGAAFRQIGAVKLLVCTVVNAVGAIVDRQGTVVRGNRDPRAGERRHLADLLDADLAREPGGNTTLTVVITNLRLEPRPLRQLARHVHASMARAIQPFHALADGDVLWAATTHEVAEAPLSEMALGAIASELAWDAVLCCF